MDMHIQTGRINSKFFSWGGCVYFSSFINSKSYSQQKNGGEHNCVFCQNVIKLNWKQNKFRIFVC